MLFMSKFAVFIRRNLGLYLFLPNIKGNLYKRFLYASSL